MLEDRQWHTGRCSGGLVVGLHGEEVAEPGLLAKSEPDEVAPDVVAHLIVIVNNSKFFGKFLLTQMRREKGRAGIHHSGAIG